MKPRIFLSHSKKDRKFILRLARDLQAANLDVWYDDWAILPGESLREKIFGEGISESDVFFIYLTPYSISSRWCKEELDAAFERDIERKGGFLALFVDADETRNKLTLDLRSKRCPVLNEESYALPLMQLISKAWEALLRNKGSL